MKREHIGSRNPFTCPHATDTRADSHILCALRNCWMDCQVGHFGEPPMCAYEEPDNSDEAVAARLA